MFYRQKQRGQVVSHQESVLPQSRGRSQSLQDPSEFLNHQTVSVVVGIPVTLLVRPGLGGTDDGEGGMLILAAISMN